MIMYSMPDGSYTESYVIYKRAYRKLIKPILRVWKEKVKRGYSFDPGLQIGSISLSDREAILLYEALTKKKFKC